MDSGFSTDRHGKNQYKITNKEYDKYKSRDKYLNRKRDRSSSSKENKYDTFKRSNRKNRSNNKKNTLGKHRQEIDYRENKNKYRPIDIRVDLHLQGKYDDRHRKNDRKDSRSISRHRKHYSPSEAENSTHAYSKRHRYNYSGRNSDYSFEKNNINFKKRRSHSSRKRSRRDDYKRYSSKYYSYHKNKTQRSKIHSDDQNYSQGRKNKYYQSKKRENRRKNSKSSFNKNRHKKRSRSYSPDRYHSYSRLGYHDKSNFCNDKKSKKKIEKNLIHKKKLYCRDNSRLDSRISSRSESSSRRSYSRSYSSESSPSSSYSNNSRRNKDAGHYEYKIGNILNNKYKILGLLGDGTFGRCLECLNLEDNFIYGVKVIRPVPRYIDSAKYEADIILEILRADSNNESKIVNMLEYFYFEEKKQDYFALVFEKLGKSLYDFIKENDYKGFSIENVQHITRQILEGIAFIHDRLKIVHTDLKPENILLKNNEVIHIKEKNKWPLVILISKNKLQKSKSPSTRSYSREKQEEIYYSPKETDIKIIDFGGATRENERHSEIINTRQYRAPEVILGCGQWNEKSDIWCLACIFSELYTGELLFPTHNNEEHLSLIEKIAGPIPLSMANNAKKEFRRIFDLDFDGVDDRDKVNFQKIYSKRDEVISNYQKLETLEDLIPEQHSIFRDFLKKLLIINPDKRPSCKEALNHEFFGIKF